MAEVTSQEAREQCAVYARYAMDGMVALTGSTALYRELETALIVPLGAYIAGSITNGTLHAAGRTALEIIKRHAPADGYRAAAYDDLRYVLLQATFVGNLSTLAIADEVPSDLLSVEQRDAIARDIAGLLAGALGAITRPLWTDD